MGSAQTWNVNCCIFWPAFGCCAFQTLIKMTIFSVFCSKNLKKARNLQQILAKHSFFAPECWSTFIFNVSSTQFKKANLVNTRMEKKNKVIKKLVYCCWLSVMTLKWLSYHSTWSSFKWSSLRKLTNNNNKKTKIKIKRKVKKYCIAFALVWALKKSESGDYLWETNTLSPSKRVLPSFQGLSTIFDNDNFHS